LALIKRKTRDRVNDDESEIELIIDNRDGTKSHYFLPKKLADLYPQTATERLRNILRI